MLMVLRGRKCGRDAAFFPALVKFRFEVQILMQRCLSPQELYQKLTDYDIRFYMYELLKVNISNGVDMKSDESECLHQ